MGRAPGTGHYLEAGWEGGGGGLVQIGERQFFAGTERGYINLCKDTEISNSVEEMTQL